MYTLHKYLLSIGLSLSVGAGYCQSSSDSLAKGLNGQSLGIQLTTTGPGVFYARTLSQPHRLALVIRGQYIAYRKPIQIETAPNSFLTVDPDFMIGIAQAGLNWHPFRRGSFFLSGGVGYSWHPHLGVVATADTKLNLGGLELTPEDVGTIDLAIRWSPVVGYVGWGFGRAIPRKRVGVGFEMGVFYLGKPRIDLKYEGFLETTNLSEQIPVVERNLRHYRYLPTLNLRVGYRLSR